jgi:hypothetical protein
MRYDQTASERLLTEMLTENGFEVSRSTGFLGGSKISAIKNNMKCNLLARHLEFDGAYKGSPLPYQVYKIKAFKDMASSKSASNDIDFVVGYNFHDGSFACVPVKEFSGKKSAVVHQREGLRFKYYNSWNSLIDYCTECGKES